MRLFQKRKKSILYLILFSFWIGYFLWSFSFSLLNMEKAALNYIELRKSRLQFSIQAAMPYLIKNDLKNFASYFKNARQQKLLDFYILTKANKNNQREVLVFGAVNDNLAGVNQPYDTLDTMIEDNDYAFKTVMINDYYFTVGINKQKDDVIYAQFQETKSAYLQDLLIVSLLMGCIVFFFLKDIIQLSKALRQKEDLLKKGFSSLSAEGQVLLSATKTFTQSEIELKQTNQHYSEVITPALMAEIKNRTATSSIIPSTLVRVDLNGYTQLFLDRKETNITEILNFYVWRSREVIERYHGLIYQIIGDEIVFHIKDSDQYDSELMALFCLRHLFDITDEVQQKFFKDQSTQFKVKASFIRGQLKFVKLDDAYALSGLPLIESVRMIGAFDERKMNSITCVKSLADKYYAICEIDTTLQKQFKGFENKTEVALIKNFKQDHQILQFFSKSSFAKYARKDLDLIKVMQVIRQDIRESNKDHFFAVCGEIRQLKLKSVSDALVKAYADLLEFGLEQVELVPLKKDYLSTLISLSYNLIPTEKYNAELKVLFHHAMNVQDPRTQANVLSALEEFDAKSELYKDYLGSESNRLAANALLVDAKKDFNKKVRNQLQQFLKSPSPFFNASAIWVIEQSGLFHKLNNLVYFNSNPYFEEFRSSLEPFTKHENPMVQKRALAALQVLGPDSSKTKVA